MAEQQRWYADPRRRAFYNFAAVFGVLTLGYAVYRVVADVHETTSDTIVTGVFVVQGVLFIAQRWAWRRTYVEVDDDSVTVATDGRRQTIPWTDIAELRPHVPYSWATHLVIIRRDGERLDLPLPADHRGLLDRWEAVASRREPPAP